ncbi:putative ccch zinc finger dna binding protein [Eutypa lata UCREL1]|uniref:Putative ccch zinc finger dna binding protein n=1 Tax=Eutypa lata (strain UCR-EL1) TaxID=1287681 RepID=M7SZW4_EUTLA|nr:putative ccch zinc finger dna binding protein [Eutypa lata UCREL1]
MLYAEHIESTLRHENALLRQELRDTRFDLDDTTKSRRDLQQRLRDTEAHVGYISQDNDNLKVNIGPVRLTLVPSVGLDTSIQFKEEYVKQGLEGGKRAANALRQAIAQQCREADNTEIIAKIVANLNGLGKAMKRDGSVNNENDLKEFMQGFTQAKASFDFVDVGHGKERADSKIKGEQFLPAGLGVSHDAGYAPFLDDLLSDDNIRRRITILEGYPTVQEIAKTGANILSMREIFRGDKLVHRSVNSSSSTPSIASAPSAPGSFSYATITQKASPPPQITLPIALKTTNIASRAPKPLPPPWNPGPRGLDGPIPVNQAVLENIKKRKDNSKLCNNHFLRGPCTKGHECCFEHNYSPTKEEINAIALLARLNPCTNGQDCDVENCIYGHHCPSVVGGVCTHPYCKFRTDEHPPGTKFKYPRASDF